MAYKVYLSPSSQEANAYAYGNTNEEAQCRRISAACAVALARCGFEVKDGNYGDMYDRVGESDAWGADLHIPIHTNAFNGAVTGTRIFCYNNYGEGYKASHSVFDALAPITPGTSESISVSDFYEIVYSNAPCVYIEVDFHDVPDVAKWIIENVELIGETIAKGVCDYFGVKFIEKPAPIDDALKELTVENEALKKENAMVKAKNASLTETVSVLQARIANAQAALAG